MQKEGIKLIYSDFIYNAEKEGYNKMSIPKLLHSPINIRQP